MRKKYLIAAGVSVLVIVLLGGGGFGYWKYKQNHGQRAALAENDSTGTLGLNSENANSNASPLSQQQQNAANAEGSNNQGNTLQTNLGQVSPTGSSGSAPKPLDPSTFGQYDQYKNDTTAKFMELKAGSGDTATTGKTAYVVYKGWLTNGTLFDQSKTDPKTGKLSAFGFMLSDGSQPSSVIVGWQQGISGMKVGAERLLIIPPSVGYGTSDHPPIPANSVLVFDVLLVAVK